MEDREIKFRAWDKEKKIMFQWDELSVDSYGASTSNDYSKDDNADYVLNQNAILMQFTGLLDKNGREIYQNDIAMVKEREDGSAQIGVVEWDTSEARFFIHVKTYRVNMWYGFESLCIEEDGMFTDKYDIRVIGNIYENPELSKLITK